MKTVDRHHVADLLPAYLNGTLSEPEGRRVAAHLDACVQCRAELAFWRAVRGAATAAFGPAPAPPEGVLARALAEVGEARSPGSPSARLSLAWQLLAGQAPLVETRIWAASALTMALGCVVALLAASPTAAGATLALFAPAIAAMGVAFVYGPENDPSLEIALSTPTPPRLVLLARLTLVYGYDLALALAATGVLALAKGEVGLLPLVSLWIGPMLFLSALALLGSFFIGPTSATLLAMGLWATKLLAATYPVAPLAFPVAGLIESFWQSEAVLLPLAALLFAGALLYAPRMAPQPGRLA